MGILIIDTSKEEFGKHDKANEGIWASWAEVNEV